MRVRRRAAGLLATILLVQTGALAQPHQPTSRWIVDYASDACLLSRAYGTDEKPLLLSFEKLPMSTSVALYAIKKSTRTDRNDGKAQLDFGEAEKVQAPFGAANIAKDNLRRITIKADADVIARAAASGSFSIRAEREIDETFAVPNLAAAFKALDQCALDLGRSWGIPIEEQKRIKRPPKPSLPLNKYFYPDMYPLAALKNDEMGRIKVRVDVNEQGDPTNCVLERPSGSRSLDEVTCSTFRKVHFEPALDVDGKPVKSFYVTTINFLIAA